MPRGRFPVPARSAGLTNATIVRATRSTAPSRFTFRLQKNGSCGQKAARHWSANRRHGFARPWLGFRVEGSDVNRTLVCERAPGRSPELANYHHFVLVRNASLDGVTALPGPHLLLRRRSLRKTLPPKHRFRRVGAIKYRETFVPSSPCESCTFAWSAAMSERSKDRVDRFVRLLVGHQSRLYQYVRMLMPNQRQPRDWMSELSDLLERLVERALTADDRIRLNALLAQGVEGRRYYRDYMRLHGALELRIAGPAAGPFDLKSCGSVQSPSCVSGVAAALVPPNSTVHQPVAVPHGFFGGAILSYAFAASLMVIGVLAAWTWAWRPDGIVRSPGRVCGSAQGTSNTFQRIYEHDATQHRRFGCAFAPALRPGRRLSSRLDRRRPRRRRRHGRRQLAEQRLLGRGHQ